MCSLLWCSGSLWEIGRRNSRWSEDAVVDEPSGRVELGVERLDAEAVGVVAIRDGNHDAIADDGLEVEC